MNGANAGSVYSFRIPSNMTAETTVITYDYDPLYRLTEAAFTGGVSAGFAYQYDAVGNMDVYTEVIGTEIATVVRYFDDANQLSSSAETKQSSLITKYYEYDDNGNLTTINWTAPRYAGGDTIQFSVDYAYNQRNLMVSQTQFNEDDGTQQVAAFVYDGANNRIQQVDYTGAQPTTTTYTNDVTGLAQVLVATDGSTTTTNLFGLDLIFVDDGSAPRMMLADGLGTVRVEMVGDAVETITTYEPFGKLLAQTGTSGTVYGYTGEAHDAATGLVYLRARYYNPYLNQFQSRDPFPGYGKLPQSQNGFNYVNGNPINYTDPTGLRPCSPDNTGSCIPDLSPPYGNTKGLFNYNVIPGTPRSTIKAYIQVNYQDMPWLRYTRPSAPSYPILIPVRHPANLYPVDEDCATESGRTVFQDSRYDFWEVNARNILAEMKTAISTQKEWALRDAIALANIPQNRLDYSMLSEGGHHYYERTEGIYGTDLKDVLFGQGESDQFAITAQGGAMFDVSSSQKEYAFALIVTYGVNKNYFYDTSKEALLYAHQNGEDGVFDCGVEGPLFLRIRKEFSYNLTTAELAAQGGWPKPDDNNQIPRWLPNPDWKTGAPPPGCDFRGQ